MLSSLAGGDALEVVVALKDLTTKGFEGLRANIEKTEATAKGSSLGGLSKDAKALGKDAEEAGGKGGGGLAALAGGLMGMVNPATLALAGIGAVVGISLKAVETYDKVEAQEKQLAQAMAQHGENAEKLKPQIDALIASNSNFGVTADDTRQALTKLTDAGLNFQQAQEALPHILDLARAQNEDVATATDGYTSSLFGNARALKQYGIILPQVSTSAADVQAKTTALDKAQQGLTAAQDHATVIEDKLKGVHTLTAAQSFALEQAQQKVKDATANVSKAQAALTLAQHGGVDVGQRLALVNNGLEKAIGGQRTTSTSMEVAQAKLNNAWEHFATAIGPPVETIIAAVVTALSMAIDAVSRLIGWLSPLFDWFGKLLGPIGHVVDALKAVAGLVGGVLGGIGKVLGSLPHLAGGGIAAGPTIVGETGPELFVPATPGLVLPHGVTAGLMGGGGTVVHTHIYLDGQVIAEVVDRHLGRQQALRGSSLALS